MQFLIHRNSLKFASWHVTYMYLHGVHFSVIVCAWVTNQKLQALWKLVVLSCATEFSMR